MEERVEWSLVGGPVVVVVSPGAPSPPVLVALVRLASLS